ncbi:MAG: response regulator [Armatimonadota bacterium]|jgi:CheY-like chemotaxis protein
MPARLLIFSRLIATVILFLSIALIIARWRYPHNQEQSPGFWELLKLSWQRWRASRAHQKERSIGLRSIRRKNILIVDADEKSVRVLMWRLESLGCRVSTVRNGSSALSSAATQSFDAIIADALLSDVSAVDLYESLPSAKPVVVFVGILPNQRDELAALGERVGYLGRPFDPEDAIALAGRLLKDTETTPTLR